ncbi:hypothetical protein ACFL1D_04685 [Candidatus Omnitrophota bacterium]
MRKKRLIAVVVLLIFCNFSLAFGQEELSKDEIVQIAIGKAKEAGFTTQEMEVLYYGEEGVEAYDEETKEWELVQPASLNRYAPTMEENQVKVFLWPKDEDVVGGDFEIIIDKYTGEIISSLVGQ